MIWKSCGRKKSCQILGIISIFASQHEERAPIDNQPDSEFEPGNFRIIIIIIIIIIFIYCNWVFTRWQSFLTHTQELEKVKVKVEYFCYRPSVA